MYENSSLSIDDRTLAFAARPSGSLSSNRIQIRHETADFRRPMPPSQGLRTHLRRVRETRQPRP